MSEADMTRWRNGSASDSRSEGCVFESRPGQCSGDCFFNQNIAGNRRMSEADMTRWRNGSASDSISEGCVFESRPGQCVHVTFALLQKRNLCKTLLRKTTCQSSLGNFVDSGTRIPCKN
ncbi:hypothetical protein TNCV_2700601 [Trichonephila clavipes]|nr:hypothetical protein TNCV_2700601 [Trichonephila clavipes]